MLRNKFNLMKSQVDTLNNIISLGKKHYTLRKTTFHKNEVMVFINKLNEEFLIIKVTKEENRITQFKVMLFEEDGVPKPNKPQIFTHSDGGNWQGLVIDSLNFNLVKEEKEEITIQNFFL